MAKKIVVITGSPRKRGNTMAMAEAFIQAAEAKGHAVTRFDAAALKLDGCHACGACFKKGKACAIVEGFNPVAEAVLAADAVAFAVPVYWFTLPAQIKAVIDHFFSFMVSGKDIAGKEMAIMACCGDGDPSIFDGVCGPLRRTAAYLKWNVVGEVLVPGVQDIGAIDKTDGCQRAAALADKI